MASFRVGDLPSPRDVKISDESLLCRFRENTHKINDRKTQISPIFVLSRNSNGYKKTKTSVYQ